MPLLSILLFALSANLDNLVISMSYGVKSIRIGPAENLIISAVTFGMTIIAMLSGRALLLIIPGTAAGYLGAGIIGAIGIYYTIKAFIHLHHPAPDDSVKYDRDHSGSIDKKEAAVLGFALSVNNTGLGVAFSMTGISVLGTAAVTFLVSAAFLFLGNWVGKRCLSAVLGKYAELCSGGILLLLAAWEMVG